jgi:hypothetical protein
MVSAFNPPAVDAVSQLLQVIASPEAARKRLDELTTEAVRLREETQKATAKQSDELARREAALDVRERALAAAEADFQRRLKLLQELAR